MKMIMENYNNNNPQTRNYCINHLICIILPKNHINPIIFVIIIISSLQMRKLGLREVNKMHIYLSSFLKQCFLIIVTSKHTALIILALSFSCQIEEWTSFLNMSFCFIYSPYTIQPCFNPLYLCSLLSLQLKQQLKDCERSNHSVF